MRRLLIAFILAGLFYSCSVVPNGNMMSDTNIFDMVHVCAGRSYAGVIEHQNTYYIIVTPEHLRKSFHIVGIPGIKTAGRQWMEYYDGSRLSTVEINVLHRGEWNYSGFVGARSACRKAASETYL